jgi:hypothetical protein
MIDDITGKPKRTTMYSPTEAERRNIEQREWCEQEGWVFDGVYVIGVEPIKLSLDAEWLVHPHYIGGHWTDTLGNELCVSTRAVNVYRKVRS